MGIVILVVITVVLLVFMMGILLNAADNKYRSDRAPEKPEDGLKVTTVIDGVRFVLVPDGGDRTCDKCALCGKLGVCQLKNEQFVEFNGIKPCRPLKGVWKRDVK